MVAAILGQAPDLDVLVVDDNSPDGTGELAERLAAAHPGRVHVLHRDGKRGLGTAYLKGFGWAFARGYDTIFEMDCDFSHDPADLLRLRRRGRRRAAPTWRSARAGSGGGGTRNWSFVRKLHQPRRLALRPPDPGRAGAAT